jgi:hypothetical protein
LVRQVGGGRVDKRGCMSNISVAFVAHEKSLYWNTNWRRSRNGQSLSNALGNVLVATCSHRATAAAIGQFWGHKRWHIHRNCLNMRPEGWTHTSELLPPLRENVVLSHFTRFWKCRHMTWGFVGSRSN